MVLYDLPKLSYSYDALDPFADKVTMRLHHQICHMEYVRGLNDALTRIGSQHHPMHISTILSNLESISEPNRDLVRYYGGGFENHQLFWECISPNGGGTPSGKLGDAIDVYYDSFAEFKSLFTDHAMSISGSGWSWLVFDPTFARIEILNTINNDSPYCFSKIPLFGIDLWEHAYYLKHADNRLDYVDSWWDVIDWSHIQYQYEQLSR